MSRNFRGDAACFVKILLRQLRPIIAGQFNGGSKLNFTCLHVGRQAQGAEVNRDGPGSHRVELEKTPSSRVSFFFFFNQFSRSQLQTIETMSEREPWQRGDDDEIDEEVDESVGLSYNTNHTLTTIYLR